MIARTVIAIVLAAAAFGCGSKPETIETPVEQGRGPAETVEFYLGNFYRSQMAKDLYLTLAPASRNEMSYNEFLLQRAREIGVRGLTEASAVARVEAAVLNSFQVNDRHWVFWALQQVRYPYAGAEHSRYRVLRLSVVNDRDEWFVEPFVDEATATVRLLPAIKVGQLRTLYDEREAIDQLVTNEINAVRAGELRPALDAATDTASLEIPTLTGLEDNTPDSTATVREVPDVGPSGPAQRLAGRLEVGELYFRAGELDAAEAAFKDALEIDPLNATATDYLDRIHTRRQLEQIKRETIELIERMLEAETRSESVEK